MSLVAAVRDGDVCVHVVNDLALLTGDQARAVCGALGYRWRVGPSARRRLPDCPSCFDRAAAGGDAWDLDRSCG